MRRIIVLLLCLLGSSSLWAQENTVLGTGALAQASAPKYAIKEIIITNPGSYSRPTINFGNHQITWNYFYMNVVDRIIVEGEFTSSVDLTGFTPTIVGGHGSDATVSIYFQRVDDEGNYVYYIESEEYGFGYAPTITLSSVVDDYYQPYAQIDENNQLIIWYYDYNERNLYHIPPTVNISFGGAIAKVNLKETVANGQNTAIGYQSLTNNVQGKENTALGHQALYSNIYGKENTAIGFQSLYATTGIGNLGVGYFAGAALTTGPNNVLIGNRAGSTLTTGGDNVIVGKMAGNGLTTGSGNVIIGAGQEPLLNNNLNGSILMYGGLGGKARLFISYNGNMKLGYENDFNDYNSYTLDVNGGIHAAQLSIKNISFENTGFNFLSTNYNNLILRSGISNSSTVFSVDNSSASMTFYTPVKGPNAINNNEFVTLGQVRDISSTTDRNLAISNGAPYLELKAAAWSGPSYVQAGVELSSVGVGNYLSFMNPAGKGFNFKRGAVNDMVINPDGNVGIGITTPQEKLAVNGKIRAREVKVEPNDNWPDYVFEESYKPMSLAEIATFVKQHKHLPEVPSAKEVAQNGLELGEMNKVLLKKIEELTLHLIEKDKQLAETNQKVDKLAELLEKLMNQKNNEK